MVDGLDWVTPQDAARQRDHQQRLANGQTYRPKPCAICTSGEFVHGFVPPDYVLDGIAQRGFLYSFTGATGAGKTAITLRLKASVALGRKFAGRDVQQGRTFMCVGENADDVRARWIALSEQMGFDADEIEAFFMPSVGSLTEMLPQIRQYALDYGGLALVIVDTSAAYFQGDDENSNKELGDHARALRALTTLPGNPCVIANCHPTKNAQADNMLPRGGGAFVAEVDGNLTCVKTDRVVDLHWQGKFRGPDFEPVPLELITWHSDRLVDTRGRPMPTVIAKPLTDAEKVSREDQSTRELHRLIAAMRDHPGASIADMAEHAGWTLQGGIPYKSKVQRHLATLKKQKLVTNELGVWTLTPTGDKAAKKGAK